MFEKMRERWTKAIHPLVLRLGGLDPSVLTWSSLALALIAFYLLMGAEEDSSGSLAIAGAVVIILIAAILDGLDGALARHQGVDGDYYLLTSIKVLYIRKGTKTKIDLRRKISK